MKIKLLVAAAATVVASSAMAQSAFQGFYGQLATGYESNTASNLNGTVTDAFVTDSFNGSNQTFGGVPLILGLGYNFSVAPKWVIGVGADYSFINQKSSSYSSSVSNGLSGAQINGQTIESSNRFNIFIAPGYEIDKDKLVYLKAGYSSVNIKANGPNSYSDADGVLPLNSGSTSKTLSGYVLGLGYKQVISGGLYGFAEGNYMNYGKTTFNGSLQGDIPASTSANASLSSYQLLVGVGYRF
jgi:opacity protein-like surface antigen